MSREPSSPSNRYADAAGRSGAVDLPTSRLTPKPRPEPKRPRRITVRVEQPILDPWELMLIRGIREVELEEDE